MKHIPGKGQPPSSRLHTSDDKRDGIQRCFYASGNIITVYVQRVSDKYELYQDIPDLRNDVSTMLMLENKKGEPIAE